MFETNLDSYIMKSYEFDSKNNEEKTLKELWKSNICDSELSLKIKEDISSRFEKKNNFTIFNLTQIFFNKFFYDDEFILK